MDQVDRLILKSLEDARAPVRVQYICRKTDYEYSPNLIAAHIFSHLSSEIQIIMIGGRARYLLDKHIYKGPRPEHDNGLQEAEALSTANR